MLRSIKDRAEVTGEFRGVRSVQQMRLYWGGLMALLVEQGVFPNKDAASDATKIASGHTSIVIQPDTGEVNMIPKHINFGSLPQHEFTPIFNTMIDVVLQRWFGGADQAEIRERIFEMLDDPALASLGRRVSPAQLLNEAGKAA